MVWDGKMAGATDGWCNGMAVDIGLDHGTAVRTTVARWVLWQSPQIVAPNLQHQVVIHI